MSNQLPLLFRRDRLIRYAPGLILAFGLVLSLLARNVARDQEAVQLQQAFKTTVEKLAGGIETRMRAHEFLLRGVAGLFAASQQVDRKEFQAYVQSLQLETTYPGTQGIGFSLWIPQWELTRHLQEMRGEGFPEYAIHPATPRTEYSSILYLEPFDWRNRRAFGFDMYSEPLRRAAMARARDTGQASLSARVTLVQETDKDVQAGTLLYVPIYKSGSETASAEQRPDLLLGWAYSPLRMYDMMEGLLAAEFPELREQIGIGLFDGDDALPETTLYESHPAPLTAVDLHMDDRLSLYGQTWHLHAYALPAFSRNRDSGRSHLIFLSGLIVSCLLALGAYQFGRSHRQIGEALRQLSDTNESLTQSQNELRTIYDASDAAMFVIDTQGKIIHANQRMSQMFACPLERLIGSTYQSHLHPDEQPSGEANVSGLANGSLPSVALERRYVRCNGETFWGYVSSRPLADKSAAITQIVGVIIETTERHEAENRLRLSEQRYRTLTETMLDVVWTIDVDSLNFTYCSPAIRQLRGYTAEEVIGHSISIGMLPDSSERIVKAIQKRANRFLAGEFGSDFFFVDDILQECKDGSAVWTEVITNFYMDADSGRLSMRGVTRNINERKRTEEERRIAAVAFESHESMVVTDHAGKVIRVNHAFEELNGYSAAEIVGKSLRLVHSGRHDEEFYSQMWAAIQAHGFWQGEIWNRRKDGELSPQWLTITAVLDAEGNPTHYVGTSFDISQRLAQENEIRNLAFYDPLTGLANRRLLMDRLLHAFAKSSRSGNLGALIYLDLDRFKELNDRLGHGEGDRLLTIVADRLNLNVREGDTVARLGGDEFVVLVEDLDHKQEEARQQARVVAEKLHTALNMPYMLQGKMPDDWKCTPSIGVALFADHRESSEALMERADRALYAAKKGGRNTIRYAEEAVAGGSPAA